MKHQSGFTLIELIMVIVVLGILAATAMPKFANMQSDARINALNGVKGSMNAAATMAHGIQQMKGYASNVSVTMAGATVAMVNGYPASSAGISNALDVDSSIYVWSAASGVTVSGTAACYVGWTQATAAGVPASATVPVTTDC